MQREPASALIVSANVAELRNWLDALEAAGWNCRGTVDSAEAAALLDDLSPSLLLLNAQMPLAGEILARGRARFPRLAVALMGPGTPALAPGPWDAHIESADETAPGGALFDRVRG